ncbi:MAG: hypothetical protein ACYSWX_11135 [Planctomycetota bacterium]
MPEPKRDLGEQPLARLLDDAGLGAPQLVDASTDGLTHKQVQRARKGRRLTANVMGKVERAVSTALGREVARTELFDYDPLP